MLDALGPVDAVTALAADGVVEADGEVIYEVKDMKVALSES